MTDFHSHVLPALDDGSKNVEMSVQMLQATAAQGISSLVATPHFYPHQEPPERFFQRRQRALETLAAQPNLPSGLQVYLGCELYFYDNISRMEQLEDCCIQGTSTLLVEMPFSPWNPRHFMELAAIQRRGIHVVVAHLERYLTFQNRRQILAALHELGVSIQLSADCCVGGLRSMTTMHMFRNGDFHLLGSDCHNMTTRKPNMEPALQKLSRTFGQETLERWNGHSQQLLSGGHIVLGDQKPVPITP